MIGVLGRIKNISTLSVMDSEIKFAGNFGPSSGKRWTLKIERGTLKNGVGYSIFIEKAKVFGIQFVKQNKPND